MGKGSYWIFLKSRHEKTVKKWTSREMPIQTTVTHCLIPPPDFPTPKEPPHMLDVTPVALPFAFGSTKTKCVQPWEHQDSVYDPSLTNVSIMEAGPRGLPLGE